jgi:hypothetical protein
MFNIMSKDLTKLQRKHIQQFHAVKIHKRQIPAVLVENEMWLMIFIDDKSIIYMASDRPTLFSNTLQASLMKDNTQAYRNWKGDLPDDDFQTGMNKAITDIAQTSNVILRVEKTSTKNSSVANLSLSGPDNPTRSVEELDLFINTELQTFHQA